MDQIVEPWLPITGCIALLIIGWLLVRMSRRFDQTRVIKTTVDSNLAMAGATLPVGAAASQPLYRDLQPAHVAQPLSAEQPHSDTQVYAVQGRKGSDLRAKRSADMSDRPAMTADEYRWMTNYHRNEIIFLNGRVEDLQRQLWRRTLMLWLAFGFAAGGAVAAVVFTLIALPGLEPQTAALAIMQAGTTPTSSRPDATSTEKAQTDQAPVLASPVLPGLSQPVLSHEPIRRVGTMDALVSSRISHTE